MDDQLLNTDDYLSWDAVDDLPVGCDFGGSMTYTATDVGTDVTLDGLRVHRWPAAVRDRVRG